MRAAPPEPTFSGHNRLRGLRYKPAAFEQATEGVVGRVGKLGSEAARQPLRHV